MSLEQVISRINRETQPNRNRATQPRNQRAESKKKREEQEAIQAILHTHMEDEIPMSASILESVKGGYLVALNRLPKTRAFLPASQGSLHGVSAPRLAETFEVMVKEIDDRNVVVSARDWLERETDRIKKAWARSHGGEVLEGEVVYIKTRKDFLNNTFPSQYIVRIGETEEGVKVAGVLNAMWIPMTLSLKEKVPVVIKYVTYGDIELDISQDLRKKIEAEIEKKSTQYPKGYKPPRRPEAKDAPNPIPTMGSKILRCYFEDLLEFNQHLPENIQHSLEKRGDWLTKDLLRGNADWYSVYKKIVARDKARSAKAEDLSDLAQEGITVGEFKAAVQQ